METIPIRVNLRSSAVRLFFVRVHSRLVFAAFVYDAAR